MSEAVPATSAQIDGAVDLTEILGAHIKGFYGGLTVLHKFDDPNLPENIQNGTIQVIQGRALPTKTVDFSGGLPATATFSRASTAFVQNAAGVWSEVEVDIARIHPLGDGIIVEPTRINVIDNPRFEGGTPGVLGSGGVLPTGVTYTNPNGLTVDYLGNFVVNGTPRMRLRFSGTSTGTGTNTVFFQRTIPAAQGQMWHLAFNIRNVAIPGVPLWTTTARQRVGTNINGNEVINNVAALVDTTDKRFVLPATLVSVGTTTAECSFLFSAPAASGYDHTFDIGMPQMELGNSATSPIMPPVGVPGASTREPEILTTPWEPSFAGGTIIVRGKTTEPNSAPPRALVEVGDGSATNYVSIVVQAAAARLAEHTVAGGVTRTEQNLGNMAPNSPIVGGITFRGSGIFQLSGNASPTVSRVEATVVVNRARLGGSAEAGMGLSGTIKSVVIFDTPISVANLPLFTVP